MPISHQLSQKMFTFLLLIMICSPLVYLQSQMVQDNKGSAATQEKNPDQKKPTSSQGGMEILSDTQGVDFAPYLKQLRFTVQSHWQRLIPDVAQPPISKSGLVVIEFAIKKDGKVANMKLVKSSDDIRLDRAAWGAIIDSIPLPTLPATFKSDFLKMRCSFAYNPSPIQPPLKAEPDATN